ncbi:MAG: class I SAM-dependent methyltransferase [Saprospiraceae bacterium]
MTTIKYDNIGLCYNKTRQADPHLHDRIYSLLSPDLKGQYLDIGCGTGNYTIPLSEKGLNFIGVDPSEVMLNEAKSKSHKIEWMTGSVESLPFAESIFDGAIATLTVHHWNNIKTGFKELYRVLKSGSRIVLFTSSPEQMAGYWLNHYFPIVMQRSIEKMPSVVSVISALEAAGFTRTATEIYAVRDDLIDLFLQSGKNRPEIYFDPAVRLGISTFASLATEKEIEDGLQKLRYDLDNNLFEAIKKKYDNDLGDYLFIVAEKH